jgi:serine/threonine protein phosphatase PrpC
MMQAIAALDFAAQSVPGRVRHSNEDALLCCPEQQLWAVADGMGGHQWGELASALAVQALQQGIAAGEDLQAAILRANRTVLVAAQHDGAQDMGTTLVAVRFAGNRFQIAWVGDSRAYRIGAGRIEQLTHDHSWVQTMVDAGDMSPQQARVHPQRNVILQCLGQDEMPQVDQIDGTLAADELLLLCSDGLSGELEDAHIQRLCSEAGTLDELVTDLVEAANQMGGHDNISCIALSLAPPPPVRMKPARSFLGWLFRSRKSFSGDA